MQLTFIIFLFKFKEIEIQIDQDALNVIEILTNLKKLLIVKRIAAISFISMKIIFVSCFAIANIISLDEESNY